MTLSQKLAFILPDSSGSPSAGFQGFLGVVALKARRVAFDSEHRIFAWDAQSDRALLAREAR
jgi:hypothetical protein